MKNILFCICCMLSLCSLKAQDSSRKIKAIRTDQQIKIDGNLNEPSWQSATYFTDFTEFRPTFGATEKEENKTEVWLLYNDAAIYVAGFCHERNKDSISTELVGRDQIGVNDFAGIMFDTYLDKINGAGFYVTALGEQYDAKYSLGNEDDSWSAVYKTATKIVDGGWYFEMEIPWSALRFSKSEIQNWGVNIIRRRTKAGKQLSWSPLNPNKFGTMNQAGILTDITDIKSPIRLSFSPYFSTYVNHAPNSLASKNYSSSVSGGMDVKYGLSKGFTLDMTLIPDFGQVQSDNQVLNLSPFEVKFNENRSFFTEGTELFNKGNLFYSRRIGGRPLHLSRPYELIGSTETLLNNPSETKLLNATKLSGRTTHGLGIGVFNAITRPQQAEIQKENGEVYTVQTSPLTNYNIVVLDQTMKNNSSVTLVNTNVMRSGKDYDANVTAGLFDLYDKKIAWNTWGKLAKSTLFGYNQGKNQSGFLYEINAGRFKGPFNFEVHHYVADNKYQQNDMGYFTNNNYVITGANAWYKINKPKYFYNNLRFSLSSNYSQLYIPRHYQGFEFYGNINSQLKNLWQVGLRGALIADAQDFYEPRKAGRVFKKPGKKKAGFYVNTNSAKKYSASIDMEKAFLNHYDGQNTGIWLSNQYRFNDKLSVSLSAYNVIENNSVGFAGIKNDSIYFGLRDRNTVENILNIKYNFNTKMGLSLRSRHYWSKVDYKKYFSLNNDGNLTDVSSANINPESNVNFFNIDMVYTWQFALGSFINIAWKDASFIYDQRVNSQYYKNLSNTVKAPQENNFSVKIIYYLDYLTLKNRKLAKVN